MATVRELRMLLNDLIEQWPEDVDHPSLEQAREYLEMHPTLFSNDLRTANYCLTCNEHDEWYGL